jgi:hypothetical protein
MFLMLAFQQALQSPQDLRSVGTGQTTDPSGAWVVCTVAVGNGMWSGMRSIIGALTRTVRFSGVDPWKSIQRFT